MTDLPVRLDDLIDYVKAQRPAGDALGNLSDAVVVGERLGEQADHLIGHFVDQARRAGASWSEIGAGMGVSKQAVQKRFVPRPGDDASAASAGMFARFTARARNVMMAAEDAARANGHDRIATKHLLLALLSEPDGLAFHALEAAGASERAVRAAVAASLPPGAGAGVGKLPFAAGTVAVLETTLAEALRLGHNYIGTEHLLLGILAAPDNGAARILAGLGVQHAETERWLLAELDRVIGAT
jgi:hypothetical protein